MIESPTLLAWHGLRHSFKALEMSKAHAVVLHLVLSGCLGRGRVEVKDFCDEKIIISVLVNVLA